MRPYWRKYVSGEDFEFSQDPSMSLCFLFAAGAVDLPCSSSQRAGGFPAMAYSYPPEP